MNQNNSFLYIPTKKETIVRALTIELTIQKIKEQLDKNITDINGMRITYESLCEAYKAYGIFEQNDVDIRYKVESQYIYAEIENELKILLENYKMYSTDINLDNKKEKRKILYNTIKFLRLTIERIVSDCSTQTLDKCEDMLYIFEDKVNTDIQLYHLLEAMNNAKANKLLKADLLIKGKQELFYPAIIDIFRDYFLLRCIFYYDTQHIDKIKRHLQNTNLKKKKKIDFLDYSLIKLMSDVKRNQEELYIFEMYIQSLSLDKQDAKALFRQLYKLSVGDNRQAVSGTLKKIPNDRLRFRKYGKFLD